MRHTLLAASFLAAALLAPASPSRADDPDTSFVRQHAIDMLEDALAPEQVTTLQIIAHQAAIAAACEDFSLDEAKFTKAFERLAPQDAATMSDDQKSYHDKHILVIYGVFLGGELAAIGGNLSDACAAAAEARNDPALADDLVWK